MALGGYLEARPRPLGLWLAALGMAGLLVSWRMLWPDLPPNFGSSPVPALILSGYLAFLGAMGVLVADRNRRLQAETQLRNWVKLLEQLYRIAPTHQTLSPQNILAEVLAALKPFFPTLVGIGLRSDFKMRVGKKTDHRHSFSLGSTKS